MIGAMKKGLFGRSKMMPDMPGVVSGFGGGTFNMDGTQATPVTSMPQNENTQMTTAQRLVANPPPINEGVDWKGALISALGGAADGAGQFFGNAPLFALQQQAQQRALQQQAQMAAQAQMDQAKRLAGLEDYRTKKGIDQEFSTPKVGSFEWFQTATPEQRQQYSQYMDVTSPAMATTWQGPTILPRSQLGAQAGPQPGTVEGGYRFKGGNPSDPSNWEPVGGTSGNAGGGFR